MKYVINKDDKQPAYMQLYILLRNDITAGNYSYGSKMPSKRQLCIDLDISVITVEHAYEILSDEGYIEPLERSGYYVTYKDNDFFDAPSSLNGNSINCNGLNETNFNCSNVSTINSISTNSTSLFPHSVYARTMRRVLSEYSDILYAKSPNEGVMQLRIAIANYLGRSRGMKVIPEQVVIGSGSEYMYGLIVQMLGRTRIYAVEDPSYEKIGRVYSGNGVKWEKLKMGKDGIRSSELKCAAATVLHVTPFNSFPSGITASASKRNEYIKWAKDKNGYIIEDDFDSEFSESSKTEDTLFSLDNGRVIYLNTFSKTIAPSVRAGYMIIPESLMDEYKRAVSFYSCTVPTLEQYAISEIIDGGDFERHINKVRRERRSNK